MTAKTARVTATWKTQLRHAPSLPNSQLLRYSCSSQRLPSAAAVQHTVIVSTSSLHDESPPSAYAMWLDPIPQERDLNRWCYGS